MRGNDETRITFVKEYETPICCPKGHLVPKTRRMSYEENLWYYWCKKCACFHSKSVPLSLVDDEEDIIELLDLAEELNLKRGIFNE